MISFPWSTLVLGKNCRGPFMKHLGNVAVTSSKYGKIIQPTVCNTKVLAKHYSKDPGYGNQLGGFEYKEEEVGFKSSWRTPVAQQEGFWRSKLTLFAKTKFSGNLLKYNPENLKFMNLVDFFKKRKKEKLRYQQQFIPDRLYILGCDLAAAHFIVYRGGAVRFCNQTNWIRDDKSSKKDYDDDLPNSYNPEYILEAIDFSKTKIIYEGLVNIKSLRMLKWLSFAYCPFFDNWCLDRVSGEYGETLEYLDISFTEVTHLGLSVLYRFKKLKTLRVEGISEEPEFLSMCLQIRRDFPDLEIEGISDVALEDDEMPRKMLKSGAE